MDGVRMIDESGRSVEGSGGRASSVCAWVGEFDRLSAGTGGGFPPITIASVVSNDVLWLCDIMMHDHPSRRTAAASIDPRD